MTDARTYEDGIRDAIRVCEEQAATAKSEGELSEWQGCQACIEALRELLHQAASSGSFHPSS